MAKVKKICAYKGCNSSDSNKETFFSFPSDPVRCQLWKDFSKTELVVPKYLCSKHFDRKKYISENPRRNILLNSAVPFLYEDTEVKQTNSSDSVVLKLEESPVRYDDHSADIIKKDCIGIDDVSLQLNEKNSITYIEEKQFSNESCKRKSNSTVMTIPLKLKKIQHIKGVHPDSIVSKNNLNYKEKSNLQETNSNITSDDDNTNESDAGITTFIFKGEEYVQMPKSFYLKEKSNLERKVQHYENIVLGIKNFLEKETEFKG